MDEKYKKLLEEILEVGLKHDQHLEYGSTFCDDDCEACKLESKIWKAIEECPSP